MRLRPNKRSFPANLTGLFGGKLTIFPQKRGNLILLNVTPGPALTLIPGSRSSPAYLSGLRKRRVIFKQKRGRSIFFTKFIPVFVSIDVTGCEAVHATPGTIIATGVFTHRSQDGQLSAENLTAITTADVITATGSGQGTTITDSSDSTHSEVMLTNFMKLEA